MKRLFLLPVLALLWTPAHAASLPASTVTVQQASEALAGLMAIDGGREVDKKDGDKTVKEKVPYKLAVSTRVAIARDMAMLRDVVTAYQTERSSLIAIFQDRLVTDSIKPKPTKDDLGDDAKARAYDKLRAGLYESADPKAEAAFTTAHNQLLANKVPLSLVHLTEAELDLQNNPIPSIEISRIALLLDPN